MKLLSAAPASFFSVASALQVAAASTGPEPTFSATHFVTWLVLAAPLSFFSVESVSHAAAASFSHLVMKLLSAAPASFLSVASDLQLAKAGTELRHSARARANFIMGNPPVGSLLPRAIISLRQSTTDKWRALKSQHFKMNMTTGVCRLNCAG